ncbi:MAG: hypothetical protein V4515_12375 [Chloroflexota bacterium]
MTDTDSLLWFQAIMRVGAEVAGIKVVHGVKPATAGAAASSLLRPATEGLDEVPALVFGYGGAPVTPGSWETQKHTVHGAIWRSRMPIDETYSELVADIGRVLNAFPARAKAFAVSAELQSVLVTSFGAIDGSEWPTGSNRWYLVLPFEIEAVVRRATTYSPS